METTRYNECRCIGRPLRFVKGECFTCGRFLPGLRGRLNADERREASRPGLGALLEAVDRKRVELRTKFPAPRHGRRVVIEAPPREPAKAKAPAGKKTHGGRRTAPRSSELRETEWLTRSF